MAALSNSSSAPSTEEDQAHVSADLGIEPVGEWKLPFYH